MKNLLTAFCRQEQKNLSTKLSREKLNTVMIIRHTALTRCDNSPRVKHPRLRSASLRSSSSKSAKFNFLEMQYSTIQQIQCNTVIPAPGHLFEGRKRVATTSFNFSYKSYWRRPVPPRPLYTLRP